MVKSGPIYSPYICAFVVSHLVAISADICQSPEETPQIGGNRLGKPVKQCPDFKDEPDQSACCPSQITPGAFFCCTEEHREDLEAELASEARRRFISSHIPELVLACLALGVLIFLFCSFLCRRTRFCPMLHRRKGNRRASTPSLHSADSSQRHSLSQRTQRPFLRSAYQQFSRHNESVPFGGPPRSDPRKERFTEAPPPYSLAIATTASASTQPPFAPLTDTQTECPEEVLQNRLNAQREDNDGV